MLNKKALYRIIDANLNRTREGLRVCEEILRFVLNDKKSTLEFKKIRQQIKKITDILLIEKLLKARDIENDVGKKSYRIELERKNYADIFFANIQRVKESLRVMEEFLKLIDSNLSIKFKEIRYRIYFLEKKINLKI